MMVWRVCKSVCGDNEESNEGLEVHISEGRIDALNWRLLGERRESSGGGK